MILWSSAFPRKNDQLLLPVFCRSGGPHAAPTEGFPIWSRAENAFEIYDRRSAAAFNAGQIRDCLLLERRILLAHCPREYNMGCEKVLYF